MIYKEELLFDIECRYQPIHQEVDEEVDKFFSRVTRDLEKLTVTMKILVAAISLCKSC